MTAPRPIVVGTAGHIDHGKSHLVRALTGLDPDRLKEEQERGITIDLGFAHLDLGDGTRIGFVDVPGHERFVRHMLAGVGGIDLVLLVVAADESVKPQTREHFDICRLLQVPRGLVVLTKTDLVGTDLLELVRLEVKEFVAGSFLESAPILPVSSRTGAGLDALKDALRQAAREAVGRPAAGLPRLPVDRAFSIKGFGTVVTGTLIAGTLREGQEAVLLPRQRAVRIRGLEVHGRPTKEAIAGQRVAANLQGIEATAIERGDLLTTPGTLEASHLLDVRLECLTAAGKPLRDQARVSLHLLATETPARLKLVGGGVVAPGGTGYAQLRTERPVVALPGDRFILRRPSPSLTIAGGVVLHNAPPKLRGRAPESGRRYESLADEAPAIRLRALVDGAGPAGIDAAALRARTGLDAAEQASLLRPAVDAGTVVALQAAPPRYLSAPVAEGLRRDVLALLRDFHAREPLRDGLPREEIRTRLFAHSHPDVFRALLLALASAGSIRAERDRVALAGHRVSLSSEEAALQEGLETAYRDGGTNPPDLAEIARRLSSEPRRVEKLLHLLLSQGRLVRIPDGKIFHADAIDALKRRLWEQRARGEILDIATFKDLAGTSRKNAIPLLEHFDQVRVTRREGDRRVILPPPAAPPGGGLPASAAPTAGVKRRD